MKKLFNGLENLLGTRQLLLPLPQGGAHLPMKQRKQTTTMKMMIVNSVRTVSGLAAAALMGLLIAAPAPVLAQDAKPEEKKGWETSANAGLALARGNTKSFLATVGINSNRKWSKDEVLLGASGGYGESTDVQRADGADDVTTKSSDYLKGFGQWNHLFTEKLYGGLRLDAVHDDIADVNYRFTLSPLIGYYFIKNASTTFAVETGPSLVYEEAGGEEDTYLGVRLAERFEHKFKNGARVWQTAEIIPQVDDFENFIVNFELGVEAPLSKKLSLRAVLQDTYDNQPAVASGPAPGTYYKLKNDVKLIAGLAYKF
jgi:putative salt-induced outer membrane protein YdiY